MLDLRSESRRHIEPTGRDIALDPLERFITAAGSTVCNETRRLNFLLSHHVWNIAVGDGVRDVMRNLVTLFLLVLLYIYLIYNPHKRHPI